MTQRLFKKLVCASVSSISCKRQMAVLDMELELSMSMVRMICQKRAGAEGRQSNFA